MANNVPSSAINYPSITPEIITQLHKSHYAIVDNILNEDFATILHQDAQDLFAEGKVTQHYFSFGGDLLKKPNVYELDLSGDLKDVEIGSWGEVVGCFGPELLKRMDELDCDAGDTSDCEQFRRLRLDVESPPAIKLQINSGGGSFPWHYDNPGLPNKRRLTCVVYLNPNWSEEDGGELVMLPFLNKKIIIPPLHRRAVFFYSDCMLHRVLPSKKQRVCFTTWCNGKNVNMKNDVALSKDHLQFTSYDEAQEFFTSSPLQRVISRAVYSEEYLESLLQCVIACHDGKNADNDTVSSETQEKLTQRHESSVVGIMTKLRPLIEEFRRRKNDIISES